MGGLYLEEHWNNLVLTTVREFYDAENYAATDNSQSAIYDALRKSMFASIFLHHFSDVAVNRGHPKIQAMKLHEVRKEIAARTCAVDGTPRPDDCQILRNVADSVKHGELTFDHVVTHVPKNERVITWGWNGDEKRQVLVITNTNPLPLRQLLDNICNAWSGWLSLKPLV